MTGLMKICVLVKPIIDSSAVQYDYVTGSLDSVSYTFNPEDLSALQWACDFKTRYGAEVTVCVADLCIPELPLDKLLKFSIDECLIIQVAGGEWRHAAGADLLAGELGTQGFDLLLGGTQSADRHGGALPILLAERLKLPCVTGVHYIDPAQGTRWRVQREDGGIVHTYEIELPAVIGVLGGISRRRYNPKFSIGSKKPEVTYRQADMSKASPPKTETVRVTEPKPNIVAISSAIPDNRLSAQQRIIANMGFSSQGAGTSRDKRNEPGTAKHIHYTAQKLKAWLKEGQG